MSTVFAAQEDRRQIWFEWIERRADLPLGLLALLIVPALILEDRATNIDVQHAAIAVNWIVWVAFCAEYAAKLTFAPKRGEYVRHAWLDLVIIAVSPPFVVPVAFQGARALRAVRVLRLLRFMRAVGVAAIGLRQAGHVLGRQKFHYVALATGVVITLGAIGIFAVERSPTSHIQSVGDAFWWAIVTTTTVGYGDVSPVTGEGRMIAVALMLVGIGFIGVFTASITRFFFDEERADLSNRLDRIEAKLDALAEHQQRKQ